jgi:hypothetical protein
MAVVSKDISEFKIQEEEVEQIVWIPREQLEQDLHDNPEKYIEAMGKIVELVT